MTNAKKQLAMLLVLLLLGQTMVACGNGESETTGGANDTDATTPETEVETVDVYAEALAALPTDKYDDRSFTILTREEVAFEIDTDSATGETTNDAVYNRNIKIEELYGIQIDTVSVGNWDDVTNALRASVTAADHSYDLAGQVDFKTYAVVSNGLCGNWLELEQVDTTKEWWASLVNDAATIHGKLFTAAGDIAITSVLYTDCMFFNDTMAWDNGIDVDDLQQTVFDGKWTIDYFYNLVADLYADENGDGVKDEGDTYGFAVSPGNVSDGWLTAFGQNLVTVSDDGHITVDMFTEKTVTALEKINRLHWEVQGTYNPGAWDLEMARTIKNRNAIFTLGIFNDARTKLADMEDDFGVLPYPKWDEAQDMYYSGGNDQFTVIVFPIDTVAEDYTFLGTITEALAIESAKTVRPAFYNSALKNRYSMDANTAEIIDLIMAGRNFDFSFQYGNEMLVPYVFRNQIIDQSNDIMSYYEGQKNVIDTAIAKVEGYYGIE